MKKLPLKRRNKKADIPSRITNDTVAEHREKVLAGGRRFKYPIQYARHKLVINAIIVAVTALLAFIIFVWFQLYVAQNTSTFFYRLTAVVPLSVARVDGERVRYSDYLMYHNSSVHYLRNNEQLNLQTEGGQRQLERIKRSTMDTVVADAYAAKLARELDISVTQEEVDQLIENDRATSDGVISQEAYDASARSLLDWSPAEYRYDAERKLLRQKVKYAVDETANGYANQIATAIEAGETDFEAIAAGFDEDAQIIAGVSGMLPQTNRDGGLAEAAAALEEGEVSELLMPTTGDGFYFVRLIESRSGQVNYAYIRVPLTEFDRRLEQLRSSDEVREYISLPERETAMQE